MDERFPRLSERQKECLRLVWEHQSSKDIARQLSLSPHTVDEYVRKAIKTLGAADRFDAARRLHDAENSPPQPLIFQSEAVADPSVSVTFVPATEPGLDSMAGHHVQELQAPFALRRSAPRTLWAPLPDRVGGERNELTSNQRLIWIFAMGLAWTMIAGAAAVGTAALKYLIR